jgi:predicted enzyme related to lactoylglutathione lyase
MFHGCPAALRVVLLSTLLLLAALAPAARSADRYWPPIVDPATGQYTPGRFVWADLVTTDVARAAGFYAQVFGWTFETYGGDDDHDTYTLVLADGVPIGGMVFDQRAMKDKVPSARWIGLISVPDVRLAEVVFQPAALGERGETAVFRDPEGALFGVVHSRNGDPADFLGDLNEWVWADLLSADVETAAAFYRRVVGYDIAPMPEGAVRRGVRLIAGGRARAGIIEKASAGATPVWLPYVRVADVQAAIDKAQKAGGRVITNPVAFKRAVVAVVADPTGAPVGVAQLNEQEARP